MSTPSNEKFYQLSLDLNKAVREFDRNLNVLEVPADWLSDRRSQVRAELAKNVFLAGLALGRAQTAYSIE